MSEYTKGPWEYRTAMNYIGYAIFPLGTLPSLAACERYTENMTITCFNFPGSTEANARLIAAAPELLEALEMVQSSYCLQINSQQETLEMKKARTMVGQAILKAKGDQQ